MVGKIGRKIRGLFAKLFRLVTIAGGVLAVIVVLDAVLSPDRPGSERL